MKKRILLLAACVALGVLTAFGFAACGGAGDKIVVVEREAGSGTRGAFEEILKITDRVQSDLVKNATNDVITAVNTNPNAVGYLSFGSLKDTVKALKIDGTVCSVETVKSGDYKIQRPFLIFTNAGRTPGAVEEDFFLFLKSGTAQTIVANEKYIASGESSGDGAYTAPSVPLTGKLTFRGSTSVQLLMEKLFAEYNKFNPGVTKDLNCTGSGAGIEAVQKNVSGDIIIGMSSRSLKASETGLAATTLATDAIAVVVNKANKLENVSTEDLAKVFTKAEGYTGWSALTK